MRLMVGSRFAGLTKLGRAASRAAEDDIDGAEAPDTPTPAEPDEDEEKDDVTDTTGGAQAQQQQPPAQASGGDDPAKTAQAAERQRTKAVLGSEHYKGREALAANLLDTEMSAEQITAALAAAPKGAAEANPMLEQLGKSGNPDLGTGGSDDAPADPRAAADAVWDRARAATARKH